MSRIVFQAIRWKNLLSTGNSFTTLNLCKYGTNLIQGHNGAGKSTLLDAFMYALFDTPFRKINKPKMINSINKKNLVVEISFKISSKSYIVRRGMKPDIFEIYCDGELLPQDGNKSDYQQKLQDILNMNATTAKQIVILGNASFRPFMLLDAKDRRVVIDSILDIDVFTKMSVLLKDRVSEMKLKITECENDLRLYENDLSHLRDRLKKASDDVDSLNSRVQEKIAELESDIAVIDDKIISTRSELEDARNAICDLKSRCDSIDISSYRKKFDKASFMMKDQKSDLAFYSDNDECPTCKQKINEFHRNQMVCDTSHNINVLEEGAEKLKKLIDEYEAVHSEYLKCMDDESELSRRIGHLIEKKKSNDEIISRYKDQLNTVSATIDTTELVKSMDEVNSKISDKKRKNLEYSKKMDEYSVLTKMLKDDGIKSSVIEYYIPIINQFINDYLSNEMEFHVSFNLDENFDETICSRYRDVFSYNNFSEGEKMRINIAILLTWRKVAAMKNNVDCNLLILDETFDSSLDDTGADSVSNILKKLSNDGDSNVFVITHKPGSMEDGFENVIQFKTTGNYSEMS
jgi:DNA repair exonuclease SbcCD ATPase subunit